MGLKRAIVNPKPNVQREKDYESLSKLALI
jgi:hypothetical protein